MKVPEAHAAISKSNASTLRDALTHLDRIAADADILFEENSLKIVGLSKDKAVLVEQEFDAEFFESYKPEQDAESYGIPAEKLRNAVTNIGLFNELVLKLVYDPNSEDNQRYLKVELKTEAFDSVHFLETESPCRSTANNIDYRAGVKTEMFNFLNALERVDDEEGIKLGLDKSGKHMLMQGDTAEVYLKEIEVEHYESEESLGSTLIDPDYLQKLNCFRSFKMLLTFSQDFPVQINVRNRERTFENRTVIAPRMEE